MLEASLLTELVPALGAVGGYALGTLQVLVVDWAKKRREHRSQLRLIRAELRRLQAINKKFGWRIDGPGSDVLPKPPDLTTTFLQTVSSVDFYLTDEHDDDNTQHAMIELTDACASLQYHWKEARHRADETKIQKDGNRKLELWIEAKEIADAYDELLDNFQTQVSSALSDTDRRLREASMWRQVNRPIGRLPKGHNPPTLPEPRFARRD